MNVRRAWRTAGVIGMLILFRGTNAFPADPCEKLRTPPWERVEASPDGTLCLVGLNGLWGIATPAGKTLSGPEWQRVENGPSGALVAVLRNGRWGFVAKATGALVSAPAWEFFRAASEGWIPVGVGESTFIPAGIYGVTRYRRLWGFVQETTGRATRPMFDEVRSYAESRAAVCYGGRWGYLDAGGAWANSPTYLTATSFRRGVAEVTTGEREVRQVCYATAPGNFGTRVPLYRPRELCHIKKYRIDKAGNSELVGDWFSFAEQCGRPSRGFLPEDTGCWPEADPVRYGSIFSDCPPEDLVR